MSVQQETEQTHRTDLFTDEEPQESRRQNGPLAGYRVIDAATVYAGPLAATMLGDFGAEVIKVEHPMGDSARTHGWRKHGKGLWWKTLGRNKRASPRSCPTRWAGTCSWTWYAPRMC